MSSETLIIIGNLWLAVCWLADAKALAVTAAIFAVAFSIAAAVVAVEERRNARP